MKLRYLIKMNESKENGNLGKAKQTETEMQDGIKKPRLSNNLNKYK